MDVCKSCRAAIIWTKTAKGKAMPVDHDARPDGNIILVAEEKGGDITALYITKDMELPADRPRFVSHFVTCPFAAAYRKSKK